MQTFFSTAALAAIALVPAVQAHGFISSIIVNGKTYSGTSPNWIYNSVKPSTAGWYAYNQDNGFVEPSSYNNVNITCHKGATPGLTSIPVVAGQSVSLQWNTWPDSHHGPVLDYLAKCSGSCSSTTADQLSWTKINQGGLLDDTSPPGKWADDTIISNNFTWVTKIPAKLAPGNYVLRHEIIALHSAGNANGAQSYPQCINFQVTGSGTTALPAGVKATSFYKPTDPGILVDIYSKIANYVIPGPALWSP